MPDTSPTLLIFGGRSTALEIAEAARLNDGARKIVHVIGDREEIGNKGQIKISALPGCLEAHPGAYRFILSMANFEVRLKCLSVALDCGLEPESVFHPLACVAPSAAVGPGTFLAPGVVVSSQASLGAHNMINYNATVGHDAVTGEHLVANPGCAISGDVRIGDRVLVGANAFIFQGKAVGDDCVIDALSYVRADLPPNTVCSPRELRRYSRET